MSHRPPTLASILVALSLNVFSSCGTIFINKYLFQVQKFKFGTTLTVLHFFFSHLMTQILKGRLFEPSSSLTILKILPLSIAFCGYVVFNNLSLAFSSISFYQTTKLLCTPTILGIEYFAYKKSTHRAVVLSLLPVLLGVFVTVFTDLDANMVGTFFAALSIAANSVYTVFGKVKQNELNANPMQLLHLQSIVSGVMLVCCIPFFDDVQALREFEWSPQVIFWILMSCCTAFLVNFSFFLLVGKTSPLTTNVVGYFKTCIVFIGGIAFFSTTYTAQNVVGIATTLLGVSVYTTVKYTLDQRARLKIERTKEI